MGFYVDDHNKIILGTDYCLFAARVENFGEEVIECWAEDGECHYGNVKFTGWYQIQHSDRYEHERNAVLQEVDKLAYEVGKFHYLVDPTINEVRLALAFYQLGHKKGLQNGRTELQRELHQLLDIPHPNPTASS